MRINANLQTANILLAVRKISIKFASSALYIFMANFFEKLKKGMGVEIPAESEGKQPASAKATAGEEEKEKPRKAKVLPAGRQVKKIEIKEPSLEPTAIEPLAEKETPEVVEEKPKETWLEPVGQLAVDVYQTENELVIQSAIAGVKPEDLDISLEGDVITISGERKRPVEEKGDYFSQECYWGKFSRQIILPVEVDPNRIEASLKDGILTIRTTKLQKEKKRRIVVKD